MSAGNQQERLRRLVSESSEAIRQAPRSESEGEDMVHPPWRHEEMVNYNGPKVDSLPPTQVTARCASGYMLGNLSIPHYYPFHLRDSNKVMGAENQQERLIKLGWVIGFVDGEGCFSIGFVRQVDRTGRKGYKTGYQVSHEFAVTQGARSLSTLHELRDFFGIGQVLINKRYDNHKEHLHRYVVRKREELLKVIIPFFKKYKMRSSKQEDFEKFAQCVGLIEKGHHLTFEGLVDIAKIAETMNRQKSRQDLIRILRGHTPDIRDIG